MINTFCISDKALLGKKDLNLISYISQAFFKMNFKINKHTIISSFDVENIEFNKQDTNVFLVDRANETLLNKICNVYEDKLLDNEYAKKSVLELYKKQNIPLEKQTEIEWKMPSKARAVINPNGITQGFVMQYKDCYLILLPLDYFQAREMLIESIIPLIKNSMEQNKTAILKTFGLSETNIKSIIYDDIKNKDKVSLNLFANELEVDIVFKSKLDNDKFDYYLQSVFHKLQKFIYAEEDLSLSQIAYKLLKLNDLTVSFAESITAGNICKTFVAQNEGASKVLKEGIVVYSNESKKQNLNVSQETLDKYSAVSGEVAYEMSVGLLNKVKSDIVLSITGYASSNGTENPGLVYISVGDKNEIHVYKNIFSGSRQEIIENATKAALFYLVKKLRKKDFYFEKNNI